MTQFKKDKAAAKSQFRRMETEKRWYKRTQWVSDVPVKSTSKYIPAHEDKKHAMP